MFVFLNRREMTTQMKLSSGNQPYWGGHPCHKIRVLFLLPILFGLKRDKKLMAAQATRLLLASLIQSRVDAELFLANIR